MTRIALACRRVRGTTGATAIVLETARRLAARGDEPHVYADELDGAAARAAGAVCHRVFNWPWGPDLRRRTFDRLFARAAARGGFSLVVGHGDTLRQDVLHLHNCVHAAHEAVRGTPLPETSSVGRFHARLLREHGFRLLVANSELMRREVVRRFGVPPDAVRVLRPGYDPARFRPEDRPLGAGLRAALGVREGEKLAGLVSSGDFAKRGVALFLEALARLPAQLKDGLHALVVGRESRPEPYRRQAARAGLEGRVHFLDPVPGVERLYHALDLCVHPALYEEFGMSAQEAMACGTPVLTSERVGASELFVGAARDLLLKAPEPEALSARMALLLEDAGARRRLAEAGLASCRGNTWDRYFAQAFSHYDSLRGEVLQ